MKIPVESLENNISLAIKGDQTAFTFLLNHFWNEVFNFILKRTGNEADAEDITIETFAKAFDKLISYNDTFAFNTWLIAIAKNVHIDLIRKRKNSSFIEINDDENQYYNNIADETPSIEDELIRKQNLNTLLNLIKLLKPHYQEVIQLRYFQELSYNEIAEILEEPLNNVKIKLLRARKLLMEIIMNYRNSNVD